MKRVKGCMNNKCADYHKTYFKASAEYCIHCGSKLVYVCQHRKCFKQIPDDVKEQLCPVHSAERKDNVEKVGGVVKKVASGVVFAAVTIGSAAKTVTDILRKE